MKKTLALITVVVTVALVPLDGRSQFLPLTGITEPFLDSTLGASVPGIVAARKVQEGDFVEKGDVLVELEKQLEELDVRRRELVAGAVETELEATRTLFQTTRSVSREELNQKETEYKVAVTEHEIAVETVRKRLITAPFSGTITEFYLQIGEPCEAQQPVLRLVDTRQCYFVCNVEPETVAALNVGDIVPLSIQTGSEPARVTGTVVFISPVVDPGSGLLRVRLLFDNADGRVRPGVAGTLLLQEASHAN